MGMKRYPLLCGLLLTLVYAIPVSADVTISRQMTTSLFGMSPVVSNSTELIRPDRNRTSIETVAQGNVVLPGGQSQLEVFITRMDKELMWFLNLDSRTFEELPLSAFSLFDEMTEPAMGSESTDPYVWMINSQQLPANDINGWPCTGIFISATGVTREDSIKEVTITYEQWVSTAVPGREETEHYVQRLKELSGRDLRPHLAVIRETLAQYCSAHEELTRQAEDLQGVPVRTEVFVNLVARDSSETGNDRYASIAIREAQAMAAYLAGQLGNDHRSDPNLLFSFSSEITAVSIDAVADSLFEIPAGFTAQ
jgi:hypothetical protein